MGTSTSPRPVICSTAEIIPIANSAWPATSARFTDSLMVLAQVALYVGLVSHLLDERRVESLGGGDAADVEQMMHRDHFGDHGDVLPGLSRIVMRGIGTPRMSVVSSSRPVRSASAPCCHSTSWTTTSMRFC